MQDKINAAQANYKKWLELKAKLDELAGVWDEALAVSARLEDFYFNGDYRKIMDSIEDGEQFDLPTDGEYSVMSEDAIWNAFSDKQNMLWQDLRRATNALDPANLPDMGCDCDDCADEHDGCDCCH